MGRTELQIDEASRPIRFRDTTLHEGELITLDGNEGVLYAGAARVKTHYPEELLARLDVLRQRERTANEEADEASPTG